MRTLISSLCASPIKAALATSAISALMFTSLQASPSLPDSASLPFAALEKVARVTVHAGYDEVADLFGDIALRRFSRELARFQQQTGYQELDLPALQATLAQGYESAVLSESGLEYVIIVINGHDVLVCRIARALTVSDPTLPRTVTIRQVVDTPLR